MNVQVGILEPKNVGILVMRATGLLGRSKLSQFTLPETNIAPEN